MGKRSKAPLVIVICMAVLILAVGAVFAAKHYNLFKTNSVQDPAERSSSETVPTYSPDENAVTQAPGSDEQQPAAEVQEVKVEPYPDIDLPGDIPDTPIGNIFRAFEENGTVSSAKYQIEYSGRTLTGTFAFSNSSGERTVVYVPVDGGSFLTTDESGNFVGEEPRYAYCYINSDRSRTVYVPNEDATSYSELNYMRSSEPVAQDFETANRLSYLPSLLIRMSADLDSDFAGWLEQDGVVTEAPFMSVIENPTVPLYSLFSSEVIEDLDTYDYTVFYTFQLADNAAGERFILTYDAVCTTSDGRTVTIGMIMPPLTVRPYLTKTEFAG